MRVYTDITDKVGVYASAVYGYLTLRQTLPLSVAEISRNTKISERAVFRALGKLEHADPPIIAVNRGKGRNRYTCLELGDTLPQRQYAPEAVCPGGSKTLAEGQQNHAPGAEHIEIESSSKSKPPTVPVVGHTKVESVRQIYDAYPRHVGKRVALTAIQRALGRVAKQNGVADPVGHLLSIVQGYANGVLDQDRKFVPYPATWFNQDRWLDESDTEPTAAVGNADVKRIREDVDHLQLIIKEAVEAGREVPQKWREELLRKLREIHG